LSINLDAAGEDVLLSCRQCGYTANEELAQGIAADVTGQSTTDVSLRELATMYLECGHVCYFQTDKNTVLVAIVPAQSRLNTLKLQRHLKLSGTLTTVDASAIETAEHIQVILDTTCLSLPVPPSTANTNHLPDKATFAQADIRTAVAGDYCARCYTADVSERPRLETQRAIEVGHTFLLGDKYAKPLQANYRPADANQTGATVPIQMGCYGLGVTRALAAIIQATYDQYGIRWPWPIAPYRVCVIPLFLAGKDEAHDAQLLLDAQRIQDRLEAEVPGLKGEVVLDDRPGLSPGWRLTDAELIGYPWLVLLGRGWAKQGNVEVQERWTRQREDVTPDALVEKLRKVAQTYV
jgi:prolyl-tRNA synthetase